MAASSLCSPRSSAFSSVRSSSSSARSVSACEWTDTYSPAAIDIAPATNPATPATNTLLRVPCAVATPRTRLAVERMPSFAPNTAARIQPVRPIRCRSLRYLGILEISLVIAKLPAGALIGTAKHRFRGLHPKVLHMPVRCCSHSFAEGSCEVEWTDTCLLGEDAKIRAVRQVRLDVLRYPHRGNQKY